ncbi:carboxypeptidase D-like [Convolutriloba macropyga]|uniref:carboxypeptidase D-like n=1 Tax=Convolutriloba macropyga TaxID=536237 RepID=UPI003F528A13
MRFYLYPDSEPVPNLSEMVNEVKQEAKYRATMDPDAFIKQLASKYPALTHIYSIGRSTGGHEMNVLVISDQPKKHELGEPELKLISSLHGNEVVGLEMLATFAEYLLVNYGFNRDITWIIDNTRIHILLSANPDGRLKMLQRLS